MRITQRLLFSIVLLALGCAHGKGQSGAAQGIPLAQLPKGVTPTAYDLTLEIDPRQERFSGRVLIHVKLDKPTTEIWLHGRDLNVTEVKYIVDERGTAMGTYEQVHSDGVARIRFPAPLPAGDGSIALAWDAPFNNTDEGLYRVQDGGLDYAFSQFEAQDARRAFPCFDEPGFKVPFNVTLIVPQGMEAVSNTPIRLAGTRGSGSKHAGKEAPQVIQFKSTLPLPTYLLAFAVGPLDIVTGPDVPPNDARKTPLPLRGVATKGKGKLLQYALQHTGELVTTLENYFGIGYPYPKLDIIAVPDFGPGAMENAGAITFKEYLLLIDGPNAPLMQRRAYASVTMHELAHQWFGDLVTMAWWDDIWLNEAFASWMAAKAVNIWDPSQNAPLDEMMHGEDAMASDSLSAARSIRQPVHGQDDVANAFDGITYSKGAAVIGMFERWVGEETFRKGIHQYLTDHSFKNATADDFLGAISQAAGKDVAKPFRTFLDQPGVPFIDVRLACEGAKPALELKTTRYVPLGAQLDRNRTWETPVCIRYEAGGKTQEQCALITQATQRLDLDTTACPRWVMPNAGGAGYYIFGLDPTPLHALVEARSQLTPAERITVAHSIAAAQGAGRLPYSVALQSVMPFAETSDWRLLQGPLGLLEFARERIVSEATRPNVEKVAAQMLSRTKAAQPAAQASNPEAQLLLRSALAGEIDVAQLPSARQAAKVAGLQFIHGRSAPEQPLAKTLLQPTFIDLALNTTLEDVPAESFEATVAKLRNATDPVERRNLLTAIGYSKGPYAAKARALIFDPAVRTSEIRWILQPQSSRLETREETWQWFVANYDPLLKRVSEGMAGHFPWLASAFCADERATEVEQFFTPRIASLRGGPRNLAAVLEQIRTCAANVKANREDAQRYFETVRE